jgi:phosphoadenosine phosphosulfate reductase
MSALPFDRSFQEKVLQAEELISRSLKETARPCFTTSFQAEGMVVLDLIREFMPDIPVLFLDTGYHFAEVLAYRDKMAKEWKLNLINILPTETVAEQERVHGALYRFAPDQCCAARKVQPLFGALERYTAWFTGLRRKQSSSRANLQEIEPFTLPSGTELQKINPLAQWSTREVWAYAAEKNISLLPLYDEGYSSIGCKPCTSLPSDAADPRSGRWGGQKLECGIHIQAAPKPAAE